MFVLQDPPLFIGGIRVNKTWHESILINVKSHFLCSVLDSQSLKCALVSSHCTFWTTVQILIPYLGNMLRCMLSPSSGANRAVLTDVVGGRIVKKSFMDLFLLMSPSIFLSGLHRMGLEGCVLTEPVQLHALCVVSWGFSFSQLYNRF